MSEKFTFTTVPNSLRKFLKGIPDKAIPKSKVNLKYLKSIGFRNSNDNSIIGVLKFVGLLDGGGVATDLYQKFRNQSEGPVALAEAVKKAYAPLYGIYEDAHLKGNDDLKNFFKEHTSVGEQSINYMVATFKALCEFADFQNGKVGASKSGFAGQPKSGVSNPDQWSPSVHINLEIHLPESKDPMVYESIFEALVRNVRKAS